MPDARPLSTGFSQRLDVGRGAGSWASQGQGVTVEELRLQLPEPPLPGAWCSEGRPPSLRPGLGRLSDFVTPCAVSGVCVWSREGAAASHGCFRQEVP